ncbi:MAG: hypothetical protein LBF12_05115 [Christensenellaceae bacterium]|jgi:hypothetical protein|nr:hypothetical protein [Christensenellaceae bacterium]
MKRLFGKILIILLLTTLLVLLVACQDGDGKSTGGTGSNDSDTKDSVDANELATAIRNGLITTSNNILDTTKRHVKSEYEFRLNTINVTIVYEANYDDAQNENSEILLKIYDNQNVKNTSFFYYYEGKLYYEFCGNRYYVPQFNYSGTFQIFYNFIRLFDIGSYLFGNPDMFESNDEFIKEEDDSGLDSFSNYVKAIITSAELDSLSVYGESDSYKNVRIKNVSLDKIKEPVNDFLTSYVKGYIGTKLDVISLVLLGFRLSDLGNVGIGIVNANTLEFAIRDNAVTDINLVIDGVQTDNVNSFYLGLKYSLSNKTDNIKLDAYDDPSQNAIIINGDDNQTGYWLSRSGEYHYKGTLYVDILNETFDAELMAKLSFGDNLENEFLLDIRKKTSNPVINDNTTILNKEIASFYYNYLDDEQLYVSLKGLMDDYLGGGIALTELGFPKARISGLDLTKEMAYYLTIILEQLSYNITLGDLIGEIGGTDEITGRLHTIISKSRTIGNSYYELTMDNEFFSVMLGDYQTSFMDRMASFIGIEVETLRAILGLGAVDDLKLILGFDYLTGEMNLSLYNGDSRFFVFSMKNQKIKSSEFIVTPPLDFNPEDYESFTPSESLHIHTEGLIYMQGSSEADLSTLFGLIIGDETGLNSPFALTINDKLYVSVDSWKEDGIDFINATIWLNPLLKSSYAGGILQFTVNDIDENDTPLIRIYTSKEDPDYFLIELRDLNFSRGLLQNPVKYKASRSGLYEVFKQMRGNNNIFTSDNYSEAYNILTRDATVELNNEWFVVRLSPYNVGGILYDPIYDILGVANMNAALKVKISFTTPDSSAYVSDESIYVLPVIEQLDDLVFDSMYVAVWHESAQVRFGDDGPYEFKLAFNNDSSSIIDGVYLYAPTARLFGQDVTYFMLITNKEIGTKRITALKEYSLALDPTKLFPIPTEIAVYYDDPDQSRDGTEKFEIENFPYTNESIRLLTTGVEAQYYTIVIGKGSIAETRFLMPIEILNRDFQVDEFIGDVPIVAVATIDPYDYAIQKSANADYNPLSKYNDQVLRFGTNKKNSNAIISENFTFNWKMSADEEKTISYHGGRFFVYDYFNDTKVALEVIIVAKEISYIQIIHNMNGNLVWELAGEYTIDAIDLATYTIPVVSTDKIQIRIYFKSSSAEIPSRYRIIGEANDSFVIDDFCDGVYNIDNFAFQWVYKVANPSLISLDGTVNTLSNATNIDTALFKDLLIGTQTVTLTVRAPSRRIQSVADSILAYTQLMQGDDGKLNPAVSIKEFVRPTAVGYGPIGSTTDVDGAFIIANPLDSTGNNKLPSTINFDMSFAGGTIRKTYAVSWEAHLMTSGDNNADITNMLPEENWIRLYGSIGDVEGKKQTITVIVHNTNGSYKNVEMYDIDGNLTAENNTVTIDPYNPNALPVRLKITYDIPTADGNHSVTDEYIVGGSGDDASSPWKYDGEVVDNNTFSYKGGSYVLTTDVPGSLEKGRLPQSITLMVIIQNMEVQEGVIFGLRDNNENLNSPINTYSEESARLLEKLSSENNTLIGVRYRESGIPNSKNEIPVVWDNAQELINALEGYKDTKLTLTGKIYSGTTNLEQSVSLAFDVRAPEITNISFTGLDELTSTVGVSKPAIEIKTSISENGNSITFVINKPYALVNAGAGRYLAGEDGNDSSLILYNFLTQTLGHIFVEFSGNDSDYYGAVFEDITGIDTEIFVKLANTQEDTVTKDFVIFQLGVGSAKYKINVQVIVYKDALSANVVNLSVEVFGESGQLLYENEPFYLPDYITVNYRESGVVVYNGVVWSAQGIAAAIVKQDENGQYINSENFFEANSFAGQRVVVSYVILPQGETITLNIDFLSKNINSYNYSATAASDVPQYNIRDGVLTVDNIYSFGIFDSRSLPSTIVPRATGGKEGFQITDGETIKFISNWLPMTAYAISANEFDIEHIMRDINTMFDGTNPTEIEIAWMRLIMYNGRTQDIILKLKVDKFSYPNVSRDDTTFKENSTEINLYVYNGGGIFDLQYPTKIEFTSTGGGTKSYTFKPGELQFLIKRKDNNWHSLDGDKISFDYLGHTLGTELYPDKNDELFIRAYYDYGGSNNRLITEFSVKILESIIEYVEIINYGYSDAPAAIEALIADVYYVDPYDDRTYNLPSTLIAHFHNGLVDDDLEVNFLPISFDNEHKGDADVPFTNFKFDPTKYWQKSAEYSGMSFKLGFDLESYGGANIQKYSITIVMLERDVKSVEGTEINVDDDKNKNPFEFLTSDLPEFGDLLEFTNGLDDDIFDKYKEANLSPAPLKIVWKTMNGTSGNVKYENDPVTNDAFSIAGFKLALTGVVTGANEGASVSINVTGSKWEYMGIAKENYTTGDPTNHIVELIEFFSDGASKDREFNVVFKVVSAEGVTTGYRTIKFIPKDTRFDDNTELTALIDWQTIENDTIRQVKFYNQYKTLSKNIINDNGRYRYSVMQIIYREISFDYGITYAQTNEVVLVLDPFNPVVPNKVKVKGTKTGEDGEIDFGEAYVIWPASVYEMPMEGGIKSITIYVCTEINDDGTVKDNTYSESFIVKVYYLDRRPVNIQRENTSSSGISYSTLFTRNANGETSYTFVIDPISFAYNSATGMYNMPENLIITFDTQYPEGDPRAVAINTFGSVFRLQGAKWIYPVIPLSGTASMSPSYIPLPFDTTIASMFKIAISSGGSYGTYVTPDYDKANTQGRAGITSYFDLRITVIDRTIQSTSVSEIVKTGDETKEYHVGKEAIDPYNIEFPKTVVITFKDASGGMEQREFQNVQWDYDETYIIRPDVISGLIGSNAMTVRANMKVYGAVLSVQFPIKVRNIDTTIITGDGFESTNPIQGGTIYILKGFPAEPQLPTYIYYWFEYDYQFEFTKVPIIWTLGNSIDTSATGEYKNVSATIGSVNKDNIKFNIEVIDPIVYCLRGSGEFLTSGGFIYNNIVVAVAGDNSYFSGQETVVLPDQIFINTAQHYIIVNQITYNIATGRAIFSCSYDFIAAGNGNDTYLRGTDGETKMMYITFEVPITTYDSTSVVSTYGFSDGESIKHFPLGVPIFATDMPRASIVDGSTSALASLELIWDFSSVNIYKAGEYHVTGYYKTAYGINVAVDFTVIIDKRQIDDSQFVIDESWTFRSYTGTEVDLISSTNLTVGLFLRDDGSFNSNISYAFEYLVNGNWTANQPLNAGTYYVRIRVDDYNYDSATTTSPLMFTISQQYVNLNNVTYSIDVSVGTYKTDETIVFDYDGRYHNNVIVNGLPLNDTSFRHDINYYRDGETVSTWPQNAGLYYMTITIEQNESSNYLVTQGVSLRIYILIEMKKVSYNPPTSITYTGGLITYLPVTSMGVEPEDLARLQITYKFYDSALKPIEGILDVGSYSYTLIIDGGGNYSSDSFGFDDSYMTIQVVKREIIVTLEPLESEYLAPLVDFNKAIAFKDSITDEEFKLTDLTERDRIALMIAINVSVKGGISDKHLVGSYTLTAEYNNTILSNYDIKNVEDSTYKITARAGVMIQNAQELKEALNGMKNDRTYIFYLAPGNYGDIEINRVPDGTQYININASVTLIGAYDVNAADPVIAVTFTSIIVYSGDVTIDIMSALARPISAGKPGVGIMIYSAASDVTVSRSYFYRDSSSPNFITSSTAIMTESGYKGTVYITNGTLITGHSSAAVLYGGSLVVSDSEISENINGVQVNGNGGVSDSLQRYAQSVIIIDSVFAYNKSVAISILCKVVSPEINFSITGNTFVANVLAIKTLEFLEVTLLVTQNNLHLNSADLIII